MPAVGIAYFYLVLPWSGPVDPYGVPITYEWWVDGVIDIRALPLSTQYTNTGFYPVGGWEVGYRGDVSISITYLSDLTTLTVEAKSASGTIFTHTQELTGSIIITFQPTEDITEILVGGRGFSVTNISLGAGAFWTNFKGQSEV